MLRIALWAGQKVVNSRNVLGRDDSAIIFTPCSLSPVIIFPVHILNLFVEFENDDRLKPRKNICRIIMSFCPFFPVTKYPLVALLEKSGEPSGAALNNLMLCRN
jgi:hypothetical protein